MTEIASRQIPTAPRPTAMPHQPQLDGLRAVAVALVFASHAGFGKLVPGGLGVTVFFFLSGYLITTLLRGEMRATGDVDLRSFYLRRALRIFPPLYLTMGFAIGLHAAGLLPDHVDAKSILLQAVFLSNYADALGGTASLALPLWSLAVEEHFYLVFPLLFLIGLGRASGGRAAALCFAACLATLGIRVGYAAFVGTSDADIWTHTRIDSILYGCCLALWRNPLLDGAAGYRPRSWHIAAAVAAMGATLALRNEVFRETLRYSLQGCALFVLFAAVLGPVEGGAAGGRWAKRLLSSRLLRRIGLYSYTIYLVHVVMLNLAEQVPTSPLLRIGLASAATLLYAAGMYRFVERPAGRLRRRLDAPGAMPARGSRREEVAA